jgi:acyl carrier protein
MNTLQFSAQRNGSRIDRLLALSASRAADAEELAWPDSLPEHVFWMEPSLISVVDTAEAASFDEAALQELSKWESMNFYSINVHGERYLVDQLSAKLGDPAYAAHEDYLLQFIQEEHAHIEMFSEFCLRYGALLPDRGAQLGLALEGDLADLIVFSKVLAFEMHSDHVNSRLARCERLPAIVRDVNRMHQSDESRHVAYGQEIVGQLARRIQAPGRSADIALFEKVLSEYFLTMLETMYSTEVYRRCGIPAPEAFRARVIGSPGRREHHIHWLTRPFECFRRLGFFADTSLPALIDGHFAPAPVQRQGRPASLDEAAARLVGFLVERNADAVAHIDRETELQDAGLLDSLNFLDFVLLIEELSGKSIKLDELDLQDFRSIAAVLEKFF